MTGFLEGVLDRGTLVGERDRSANLPANVHSQAYAASIVAKQGPGLLLGFTVYNSKASAQFIQVFDSASVLADGAIPAAVFTVAASSNIGVNWIPGRSFQVGCVLVNSSTGPTKTIGSADCFFDVQYV